MIASQTTLDPRRRPNLLGIGGAKCGTTWFADMLSRHPDIFMPPQKELNALYYDDVEKRLGEYQEYFRGGESAKVRCDFSVRYLNMPNAPRAAARYTPDARIIAILRDPVDQVQSHYWHQRRQNFCQPQAVSPAPDLFEALERFPELLLDTALYGKHLRRWRAHFPEDRILLLDYSEVINDIGAALDRVWTFMGLPSAPAGTQIEAPATAYRRGVAPRGGALGRIYPVIYGAVTHGPYQAAKRLVGVRRIEALKRQLKLRQAAEAIFFKPGYPKLGMEDRRRLRTVFADDLALLEEGGFAAAAGWKNAS